jgi:hypothetical protein
MMHFTLYEPLTCYPLTIKSIALHSLRVVHSMTSYLPSVGRFQPVRGMFSAYTRLCEGQLTGGILAKNQEIGMCPPGSMTELAQFDQHHHQPWPVFWTSTDDATLVGRLHLWRDPNQLVCKEAVYNHPSILHLGEDRATAPFLIPAAERLTGAWTSLASKWNDGSNYFHWLLDGLTRLQIRESLPEQTGILVPSSKYRFVSETLELLGLLHLVRESSHPALRPDRYYFCAPSSMTGVWNPMGFQWLRKQFSDYTAVPSSGPSVFLTRRGAARVPRNITAIEKLFVSHGFQIVDCGTIPVREQIRIVSAAKVIAGLHGAAMTNLLWAPPDTRVLELFQPGYRNACYEQIAFQGKLNYTHLVTENEDSLKRMGQWLDE